MTSHNDHEPFWLVAEPRLADHSLLSGSRALLARVHADQLFVFVPVVVTMHVPEQEHLLALTTGGGRLFRPVRLGSSRQVGTAPRAAIDPHERTSAIVNADAEFGTLPRVHD